MGLTILLATTWLVLFLLVLRFYIKDNKINPYLLFLMTFALSLSASSFFPLLHPWDEQFHALVAKNSIDHLLQPRLFLDTPLLLTPESWTNAGIWLHKQPLFTWLPIPFIKFLGATAFNYRLIFCILYSLLPLVTYQIHIRLFDRATAFWSALVIAHSPFLLRLLTGTIATDQNDLTFMIFISLSLLFLLLWLEKPSWRYTLGIGLFVGFSILTKWLVGILVFAPWGMIILLQIIQRKENDKIPLSTHIKHFIFAIIITIIVFLPWQIFAFTHFHDLYINELAFNFLHLSQAVEGHSGHFYYHFVNGAKILYLNPIICWILFLFGSIHFIRNSKLIAHRIFLWTSIGIIYLFFSFVQTKMPAFCAPVYLLMIGLMVAGFLDILKLIFKLGIFYKKIIFVTTTLLFVVMLYLSYPQIKKSYTSQLAHYKSNLLWEQYMVQQPHLEKRVVFNVNFNDFANINWMFFTDDIAYNFYPNQHQIDEVIKKGYTVYILSKASSQPDQKLRNVNYLYFSTIQE